MLAITVTLSASHAFAATDAPTTEAQLLLDAREYESAIEAANASMDDDKSTLNQMRNLRIIGDAHLGLGEIEEAVESYSLARYEMRTERGLHRPEEIELLLREAAALSQVNDIKTANDRHEYVYSIRIFLYAFYSRRQRAN